MILEPRTYNIPGAEMRRLLIVDNEETVGFFMTEYFKLHGYQVDYARDRFEAEDLLSKTNYEVLIEDLWLSNNPRAGLDVIEFAHERHPSTLILVLTAHGSVDNEKEARRRGADAFLSKPQSLREIAHVITGLLNLREEKSNLKSDAAGTM
jgi:DNA-binding NtrC family response regulator